MSNGKLMLFEYRCSYLNCIFHFQKKMSEQIDLIANSKLNDCFNQTVKRCYHCHIVVTKQTI